MVTLARTSNGHRRTERASPATFRGMRPPSQGQLHLRSTGIVAFAFEFRYDVCLDLRLQVSSLCSSSKNSLAETAEPEEVMKLLRDFRSLGQLVHKYSGSLDRFTGDGLIAGIGIAYAGVGRLRRPI